MVVKEKKDFMEYFSEKLSEVAKQQTFETLGDRRTYIGASDIAGCLRKAYLDKFSDVEHPVKKLIQFSRGHMAERIVESTLISLKYESQCEIVSTTETGFPVKAHLDFLVFGKDELVVLETKTTSTDVTEPYDSWVNQIQYQMGKVKEKYPDKTVRGYVVAINLNSGYVKTFKFEFEEARYFVSAKRADKLALAIQNNEEPEGEEEFYCSSCPHKEGCPALQKGEVIELPRSLAEKVILLAKFKDAEQKAKRVKTALHEFMQSAGARTGIAGEHTLKYVKKKGVEKFNISALENYIKRENIDISLDDFKEIGDSYSYVQVI
ncbi:MAG: hypothetical protein LRY50_13955 [Geovibrio sp.]|nr:hypothetical protein [Geovibrio sp.]